MSHLIRFKKSSSTVFSSFFICLIILLSSTSVFAEAGRVVFAYGEVTAEDINGVIRKLSKRSQVNSGETIRTSSRSLVQMRMIDKAFIALRSNSEVKIESYSLGATKEEDTGIFSLLRGGFRAVTGIIGKRLRSAYKMRTPTATIGIRGTDYTARLCNQDCNQAFGNLASGGTIADGLYVGVNEGGIDLTNQLGTLDLDELQFGYVKDATTAPVALSSAPEFLYFNSRAPNPDDEQAQDNDTETVAESAVTASRAAVEPDTADLMTDDTIKEDLDIDQVELDQQQIEQNIVIDQVAETENGDSFSLTEGSITSSRMVVSSYGKQGQAGSISSVHSNPFSTAAVVFADDGKQYDMKQFDNSFIDNTNIVGSYSSGSSSTIDWGYDPSTGIAWGRWGAGLTQFQPPDGGPVSGQNFSSLHWVSSPDQSQAIALPSAGSASFVWSGNTNPTDNHGNTGTFGNATLDANFTNMTVDTSVAIGINNQVWTGEGIGMDITANGGFAGNMTNVNVDTGAANISGTGNTAGFFTNNATGAGMGFSLEADINGGTTVNGAASFIRP